jgi:hypothetical protein
VKVEGVRVKSLSLEVLEQMQDDVALPSGARLVQMIHIPNPLTAPNQGAWVPEQD